MKKYPWIAVSLMVATPAGALQVAAPVATTEVANNDPDTDAINRAALAGTAAQTAKIIQDKQANAASQAAYVQAQARYAQDMKDFEAAKLAVAKQKADNEAAYQQQLANWRHKTVATQAPKRKVETAAASNPTGPVQTKLVCTMEKPTGSNITVRHCRTVAQIRDASDTAQRELDKQNQNRAAYQAVPR